MEWSGVNVTHGQSVRGRPGADVSSGEDLGDAKLAAGLQRYAQVPLRLLGLQPGVIAVESPFQLYYPTDPFIGFLIIHYTA